MHYTSGPGLDSRSPPNIFDSVLFKKPMKERQYIHLMSKRMLIKNL